MSDIIFAPVKVKKVSDTLFDLGLNVEMFTAFLEEYQKNGWVHINIAKSKDKDNWYGRLNTWQPNKENDIDTEEIPF